jgi:hypothetical protein
MIAKTTKPIVTLMIALGFASAQTVAVVWDDARPSFLNRGVVIDPSSFNEDLLSRMCNSILDERPRTFVQVTFFPSDLASQQALKLDHITFSKWRELHDIAAQSQGPIAQLTAINNDAVLRLRNDRAQLSSLVLKGKNPLIMRSPETSVELIYIAIVRSIPGQRIGRVEVYATADRLPDPKVGVGILASLEQVFQDFQVSLLLRNDRWFVSQIGFPYFYPFANEPPMPSEAEYRATNTMSCIHFLGPPNCVTRSAAHGLN